MRGSAVKFTFWNTASATRETVSKAQSALVSSAVSRLGESRRADYERAAFDPEIAFRLGNTGEDQGMSRDEAFSWIWLAATLDHAGAARQIGTQLTLEAAKVSDLRRVRLLELSKNWFDRARDIGTASMGTESFEDELAAEVIAQDSVAPVAAGPGRVVVAAIGDPESKEGRDLKRRFDSSVGTPLPYSGRVPEPGEIREGILQRWPWAVRVADELERSFAVLRRSRAEGIRAPSILLVGAKGCGKTSMAKWVCEALGIAHVSVPCGGASDAAGLTPVARAWSTMRPGAVFQAMAQNGTCNPAIVLEEIDKTSQVGSQNGSVSAALLSMVGEETFTDSCLMAPVDISAVSWLATANSAEAVDEFLRDRFKVIKVPSPRDEDVPALHRNAVSDYARRQGIPEAEMPELREAEMRALAVMFVKRGRSARAYYDMLESLMSKAIAAEEARGIEERRAFSAAQAAFEAMEGPTGSMH